VSRFAAWIEPALVAEWIRLMHDYAAGQRRTLDLVAVATATVWSDPDRGVGLPRRLALDRLRMGSAVHCVWSGRVLDANSLDMDHCLPWAALSPSFQIVRKRPWTSVLGAGVAIDVARRIARGSGSDAASSSIV
jgi:hypothetical protein